MKLFAGTLTNFKLDSKGRLSIPTKWRERLGKEFYMVAVTVKGCQCIALYPTEEFEKLYESTLNGNSENQRYASKKELLSKTEEATMDAQGRLTLNQRLKEMAFLKNDSDIIYQGNGDCVEIWDPEQHRKMESTFDPNVGLYDIMDRANGIRQPEETNQKPADLSTKGLDD